MSTVNRLFANLSARGRLLRAALTRRYIYDDVVPLALARGHLPVEDVAGDMEPIEFLDHVTGKTAAPVSFAALASEPETHESAETANWTSERGVAEFIGRLTWLLQAETVFEIGCFTGYTSAHICTALAARGESGRLHYLDFDRAHLDHATARLRRLGFAARAASYHGRSVDPTVLAKLPAVADLVFIDTTHGYADTVAEIAAYGPRLSERGVIVLHDSIRFPGVRQAIAEAKNFRSFTFATERANGVTVLVPRREG